MIKSQAQSNKFQPGGRSLEKERTFRVQVLSQSHHDAHSSHAPVPTREQQTSIPEVAGLRAGPFDISTKSTNSPAEAQITSTESTGTHKGSTSLSPSPSPSTRSHAPSALFHIPSQLNVPGLGPLRSAISSASPHLIDNRNNHPLCSTSESSPDLFDEVPGPPRENLSDSYESWNRNYTL